MSTLTFKGTASTLRIASAGEGVTLTRHEISAGEAVVAVDGPAGRWLRQIVDGELALCAASEYTAAVGQIAVARVEAALAPEEEVSA